MSASLPDESLERLNYFNGQRLAASDLRAEQRHHLGVRRLLNRSLYSAGIVNGLEVRPHPGDPHKVVVRSGLAFDHLGREIALLADAEVQVMGMPSPKGMVIGNLLVVSYREQRTQPVSDGCAVAVPGAPCGGDLAWGAPTRIVADVVFEFLDSWPAADSGKVVVAQLDLDATCTVKRVLPGVRRYATAVKPQQVHALSLEGEKAIDLRNPKVLYFHIDGGHPEAVTLHLRSRRFPSLYYTEMGRHDHATSATLSTHAQDYAHSHPVSGGKTTVNGQHRHGIWVDDGKNAPGVDVDTGDDWNDNIISEAGQHDHDLKDVTLGSSLGVVSHTHTLSVSAAASGVGDEEVRRPVGPATTTSALQFVLNLRVILDDALDITDEILKQLRGKPGQASAWPALGDAGANTLAGPDGTGDIDLLRIPGVELGLGRHTLTFRVDQPGVGGTVQYNLYVR